MNDTGNVSNYGVAFQQKTMFNDKKSESSRHIRPCEKVDIVRIENKTLIYHRRVNNGDSWRMNRNNHCILLLSSNKIKNKLL